MTENVRGARRSPTWIVATIAGLFALLYAFAVWNGVAQLVMGVQAGAVLTPTMWAMWLLTIVLPIAIYAVILITARARAGLLGLALLAGLAVVGVFWMNVMAYVTYVNLSALLAG